MNSIKRIIFGPACLIGLASFALACASTGTQSGPQGAGSGDYGTVPDKIKTSEPLPESKDPGVPSTVWNMPIPEGMVNYRIETSAQIALIDTTDGQPEQFRTNPTEVRHVTLLLANSGASVINPPEPDSRVCNDTRSIIQRALGILPDIPADQRDHLTIGSTWQVDGQHHGCRGPVPLTYDKKARYLVLGDTTVTTPTSGTTSLIIIEKIEHISAKGEGNDGQHRLFVEVDGDGRSLIYMEPSTGLVWQVDGEQSSTLSVLASGRKSSFAQKILERITKD